MSENIEAKIAKATTTLATMLDYLGLEASVKSHEKNGKIILTATSDDAGRIIGRKGKTLEDLQLLVNKMMQKGDEENPKIIIDVDGYTRPHRNNSRQFRGDRPSHHDRTNERGHDRRRHSRRGGGRGESHESSHSKDEMIRQQALDASKEVKKWGESVTLPPMNSHDRRIVHMTLKDDIEVTSESREEGDSNMKKIVISLKK